MATIKELALTYAQRISSSQNPTQEVKKIRIEIENLVSSPSDKKISADDKIAILQEVKQEIKQRIIRGKITANGKLIKEAGDNSGTLDVIDSIINDMKRG